MIWIVSRESTYAVTVITKCLGTIPKHYTTKRWLLAATVAHYILVDYHERLEVLEFNPGFRPSPITGLPSIVKQIDTDEYGGFLIKSIEIND